jgi:hypothetical protein
MVKNERNNAVLIDLEGMLIQAPWANHQHAIEFQNKTVQARKEEA